MYATYHMANPNVFYQREDVWKFATEHYREEFQSVSPYYMMVHFLGEENLEMVLMLTLRELLSELFWGVPASFCSRRLCNS